MKGRWEAYLYVAQRASAIVMAPLVIGHLVTIAIAVQTELSAQAILERTSASPLWGIFYTTFVIAAGVHAAIGLRTVAAEWLRFRGLVANWASAGVGAVLIYLGLRAVAAVT